MKKIILCFSYAVGLIGCSTSPTAVDAVWSKVRLLNVDSVSPFLDEISGSRKGHPLPSNTQGEEFDVRWHGAKIEVVKFEYRQVKAPDKIFHQEYFPKTDRSHTFSVLGEAYRQGGAISGWRVSLWRGTELLAEKKSSIW